MVPAFSRTSRCLKPSHLKRRYLLMPCVHVSLSPALPRALASWTIPHPKAACGLGTYSRSESCPGVTSFRISIHRDLRLMLYTESRGDKRYALTGQA